MDDQVSHIYDLVQNNNAELSDHMINLLHVNATNTLNRINNLYTHLKDLSSNIDISNKELIRIQLHKLYVSSNTFYRCTNLSEHLYDDNRIKIIKNMLFEYIQTIIMLNDIIQHLNDDSSNISQSKKRRIN